ncbi:MAG: DUF4350 domain-containing protein [Betaproteobacteria bacterium]|nr:DUF4350 domain-containing protein [Betaproteobacteria bacterium]
MRISIGKLIVWLLLLLLLAFFLWAISKIEYVEEKITGDFRGAALRNPLLAVGRLAEHYGATAHHVPTYRKPPQSGATLVFTAPRHWFTPEQNDALLDWAKTEGSHLIVVPQQLQQRGKRMGRNEMAHDTLLVSLGISVRNLGAAEDDSDEPYPDEDADALPDLLQKSMRLTKPEALTIELPDGTHLKARFSPQWRIKDLEENSDWHISDPGDEDDGYVLSQMLGKGRVTVLTNLDFINNRMIGEDDHAALFVYLVSLEKGQDIWFVHGTDVPALWRWLVNYAWTVLVAAALLLITWLWSISRRFGPLLPARSRARRSIAEHVAASARYLWRGKQEQALYRTLCNDFYQRAYLHHPHWSQLSVQELNQEIALFAHETQIPQLSGLTEQAVERLLDTSRPRDKNQFAADSHLLDILRNRL